MSDCINIITAGKSGRSRIEIPRDIYVDYFYEDVDITVRKLSKENVQEYLTSLKSWRNKESTEEYEKIIKNINNALYVITICAAITDGATRYPTLIEFLCTPKESCETALDSCQEEELNKFLKNEVRTSIYDFYKSASKSSTVNEIDSEKEILSIFAKHIEHIPYVDIICRCDDNVDQIDQHEKILTYKFG